MKQSFGILLATLLLAAPAFAQDLGTQITDQLRQQGYSSVQVTKTWLGRLRIEASSADQRREIIVNPRTGEILRDFLSKTDTSGPEGVQILDRPAAPRPAGEGRDRAAPNERGGKPDGRAPDGGGRGGAGSGPEGPGGSGGSGGPSGPSK